MSESPSSLTPLPPQRRKAKDLPLTRLLPNMLTMLSLCSGLTAIRFAMQAQWQEAVLAIVVAGVFDMLDGRVARMLNIVSKFGAELDSLADAISFGVAPGFVMYLWVMKDSDDLGWVAVLVYAVCGALRLARFNTMLEDPNRPVWAKGYFVGTPAPAGAGLAITPLVLVLLFGPRAQLPASVVSVWLILAGGLMISQLPTFALKGWRVAPIWVAPIFIGALLLIAAMVTHPWLVLFGIQVTYIVSLPLASYAYWRRMKLEEARERSMHA
jgi:CDP-diacylglycerol--serine O-phosphatidyltransferase